MQKNLEQFDLWLIECIAEPFSRSFQKTFGYERDCFWLARKVTWWGLIALITHCIAALLYDSRWWFVWSIQLSGYIFIKFEVMPRIFQWILEIKDEVRNNQFGKTGNRLKIEGFISRMMVIGYTVAATSVLYWLWNGFGVTVPLHTPMMVTAIGSSVILWFIPWIYLVSCDPLPPARSRVERFVAWIKSFRVVPPESAIVPAPSR